MIDERRPIDTPLCYREAKIAAKREREKRGEREKERERKRERNRMRRENRGESRELIPGCIEALLSL